MGVSEKDLELYIIYLLDQYEIVVGHSGLALGADTIWSKAILSLKVKYPGRVKFHAEIPNMEQHSVWYNKSDIDYWHEQVKLADNKSIYGSLANIPESQKKGVAIKLLNDRNIGMVDHCDILLAVWDGSSSGTKNAVDYARKINKEIIIIDPKKYFK